MNYLNIFLNGDVSKELEGYLCQQINNAVQAYNGSVDSAKKVNVAVITEKPVEYHEPPF